LTLFMAISLSQQYATLAEAGEIERDPAQDALIEKLAQLEWRLVDYQPGQKSWWSRLFGVRDKGLPVKGLYIFGDVGRGKTMLMDLFFDASMVARKHRAHFHEFMTDVHERIHSFRQTFSPEDVTDPIALTATSIARETRLLCFDELHVTDIADAMILGRLFEGLFERGVTVVATSNVPPRELYKDGLNRALFLPFVDLIEQHMEVVQLDARIDYRLEKLMSVPVWYVPAGREADAALDAAWRRLAAGQAVREQTLSVHGHDVRVPRAARGVARFSFADLCAQPLAAADYLKIAHEFHTLILDRIPVMDFARRNEAKRFIILIDTLYDQCVKLVASAEAEPDALYRAEEGFEAQEFKRTASRLIEMRSDSYLAQPHGGAGATAPGSLESGAEA
jgi:cell division protein ZapE